MSWLFSQVLVEEYLVASSTDGEQSAPLNVTPSQRPFWRNDKTMDVLKRSPFGLTWKLLTADRGEALLTSFLAAFHAQTSPAPVKEQGSTEKKADFGESSLELLAKWNPATSSWKTAQCSLFGDSDAFSGTWPRWGTMQDGECWEQTTPGHLTGESESGLLPTPLSTLGTHVGPNQRDSSGRPGLQMAAMMWHTPTKVTAEHPGRIKIKPHQQDCLSAQVNRTPPNQMWPTPRAGNPGSRPNGKGGKILAEEVKKSMFPTPTKSDHKGSGPQMIRKDGKLRGDRLDYATERNIDGSAVGGRLNPTWVEWLMGWPLEWTDLKPLETDKFRQWLDSHGIHSSPHPDKPQTGE